MVEVVQAFDRKPIACLVVDDEVALEKKLSTASCLLADRNKWLEKSERIKILHRLSDLVAERREHFGHLIAREGGKPLTDALEIPRVQGRAIVAYLQLHEFTHHQGDIHGRALGGVAKCIDQQVAD